MDDNFMTMPELAEYLSIGKWTLYRWVKEKDLPVYKMGGLNRFRKSEIDEWVMRYKKR